MKDLKKSIISKDSSVKELLENLLVECNDNKDYVTHILAGMPTTKVVRKLIKGTKDNFVEGLSFSSEGINQLFQLLVQTAQELNCSNKQIWLDVAEIRKGTGKKDSKHNLMNSDLKVFVQEKFVTASSDFMSDKVVEIPEEIKETEGFKSLNSAILNSKDFTKFLDVRKKYDTKLQEIKGTDTKKSTLTKQYRTYLFNMLDKFVEENQIEIC